MARTRPKTIERVYALADLIDLGYGSRDKLTNDVHSGALRAVQAGGKGPWLVNESDLREYLVENRPPSGPTARQAAITHIVEHWHEIAAEDRDRIACLMGGA